jgi:5-methylthioribose kinase
VDEQIELTEENLPEYLKNAGFIPQNEPIAVEKVGDGNINWVRRVRTDAGSWVVKQARPALERFPEYRSSTERIVFEARFFHTVAPFDAENVCPRVLRFDPEQRVLVLEDLGDAERLDAALARGADVTSTACSLARFLGAVHRGTRDGALAARFANGEMRQLHGDHIFHLPFRENDFPLSKRVAECAAELRADTGLLQTIDSVHRRYLEPRGCLVHGDVQPANVLLSAGGPKLLDAEIAHVGDPAFDLGQLLGHLLLPAAARGEPEAAEAAVAASWGAYESAWDGDPPFAFADAARHGGIELLRRTLGAARLPAVASDDASLAVVAAGLAWIREPPAMAPAPRHDPVGSRP